MCIHVIFFKYLLHLAADRWAGASNPQPQPSPTPFHMLSNSNNTNLSIQNTSFSRFQLDWLYGPADQQMDKASHRVACMQLKTRVNKLTVDFTVMTEKKLHGAGSSVEPCNDGSKNDMNLK